MVRRSISIFAILLYGLLTVPGKARAETTLNRAVVEETRNQVQLLLQNQSSRLAQVSDVLVPGDGLSTANDALAELRFNDGSLGRLGEQVVFWFTPGTRNFSLSNGTVLLLIPPGQGRTTIQTPNASAGIQGSALFVRYIEETDTTVVGALTDSDIQVTNADGSQQYTLVGGEMAVAVGDRITDIFEFDLQTFYETSNLARDLAPPDGSDRETTETEVGVESSAEQSSLDASESVDPAIAAVQAEMRTALQRQQPISAENSVETPDFLRMPTESSETDEASDPASSNTRPIPAPSETGQSQAQEAVNSEIPAGLENPINDPARTSVGEPPGRDIDEIPAGRGPNDDPGQEPDNNPGNAPDNNPGRGPDNKPGNGPDNNSGREPDNNPGNAPDSNPGRGPDNNPGRGPDNNPGNGPDNNPGREPDNNPGRGPDNNPGNGSDNNPGQGPDNNPGNGPDNNPGREPDNNPGNGPDNNPGRGPDNNPGNGPDNNPGNGPDNNPGRGPDNNPGRGPDNNPGNEPDNNPGRGPDNNPGNGPDNNPGRGPDNNPGRGPDNNPGRGPDNNPGRGPDNNPGNGPDNNPGRGPNNNSGNGPGNNSGNGPNNNPGRGN